MFTENRNINSKNLHNESTLGILNIMNKEDETIPRIIKQELSFIAKAADLMADAINNNHSVIYIGAGTSGRLGVLDASECPPTFGVPPHVIKGIIAGGDYALRNAVENAEDDKNLGKNDIENHAEQGDVIIGLATSGQTPYVLGAIEQANKMGLKTIGISCNKETKLSAIVDIPIELVVGPEVITGSTRLKAGTAQKLVLNMLSTAAMVKTGKVYENLMVNLQPTNIKLEQRSVRIIKEITNVDDYVASQAFANANKDTRVAILTILFNISPLHAKKILYDFNDNFISTMNFLSNEQKS